MNLPEGPMTEVGGLSRTKQMQGEERGQRATMPPSEHGSPTGKNSAPLDGLGNVREQISLLIIF
jgi:hypothetical protein